MQVQYTINTTPHTFETQAEEDLPVLCAEITSHLQTEHPETATNSYLTVKVCEGVLNSLAANSDEIDLGELAG